jgi:parvulin-like peptidyl-prolyl isomerase
LGDLIPPFKSRKGWEVVIVLEKTPPGLMTFEKARIAVKQTVAYERTAANVDELVESLRAATPIRVIEANLAQVITSS